MKLRTMNDMPNVSGKNILLRCDFNIKVVDGKLNDTFRIEQSLPTIKKLIADGARVTITAHLNRPEGRDPKETLRPSAVALEQLLGRPVKFIDDALERGYLADMKDGEVAILENVRYYKEEEKNDAEFAKKLAVGFDFYINDAFSNSHRAHASMQAIAKILPSYAGLLLAYEVETLQRLMTDPARPAVAVIGSSKLSSKIDVIRALCILCDKVIIGGALGTTFNIVFGARHINDMLYKPEYDEIVKSLSAEFGDKLVFGIDKGVGKEFAQAAARTDKDLADILPDDIIMDEGPKSVEKFNEIIDGAKTVIYNGTVGMAEWGDVWGRATFDLLRHIAKRTEEGKLESIIGGGDGAGSTDKLGLTKKMTYVSTGGGAFLEFIEGKTLPAVVALIS